LIGDIGHDGEVSELRPAVPSGGAVAPAQSTHAWHSPSWRGAVAVQLQPAIHFVRAPV